MHYSESRRILWSIELGEGAKDLSNEARLDGDGEKTGVRNEMRLMFFGLRSLMATACLSGSRVTGSSET